jgi:hypothetical protein
VIPTRELRRQEGSEFPAYDGEYLADFAKVAKILADKSRKKKQMKKQIRIEYADPNGAARVDIGREDVLCVLMPISGYDRPVWEWIYGPDSALEEAA